MECPYPVPFPQCDTRFCPPRCPCLLITDDMVELPVTLFNKTCTGVFPTGTLTITISTISFDSVDLKLVYEDLNIKYTGTLSFFDEFTIDRFDSDNSSMTLSVVQDTSFILSVGKNMFYSITVEITEVDEQVDAVYITNASYNTYVSVSNIIDPPQILISIQNNSITKDVVEVIYSVTDNQLHEGGLGNYCGSVINVINGTQFQVLFLEVNCAVIGTGSLFDKILDFNESGFTVDGIGFIGYILLKILLGRLVNGLEIDEGYKEFNLKWAYRNLYPQLYSATLNSSYSNIIPMLKANNGYENLLKWD